MPDIATLNQALAATIVAAPGVAFGALGFLWLAGWTPGERALARVTALAHSVSLSAVFLLAILMRASGITETSLPLGTWFSVGHYDFALALIADRLSLPMMALTALLGGLIGSFSRRYLHRDRGYFRFFLLLHLFTFGALLAFAAGSLDLMIGGWELVGLTSVLLIAFFNDRRSPVQNALRVFATYRISDLGLLIGVFVLHHAAGTATWGEVFAGVWPNQSSAVGQGIATLAAGLLVLAAMGKSAQVPFSGWLPRAMEGPTPSSAIFYGAISVHLGAYLLLRIQPLLDQAPGMRLAVVCIGAASALHATLSGRAAPDAKTSLAYASMAQVGIIFVEAGFGLEWLALIHTVSHAAIRTLQFLRAPSMLHDYHRLHAGAGGHLGRTGAHYEALLPAGFRRWLYRMALDRGHFDTLLDRFVTGPLIRAAEARAAFEAGVPSTPHPRPGAGRVQPAARGIDA
ncbi:MAG TPA: hypothetical protein DEH78_20455 [Solibacterales bacterium]|nr:hypothetical protein [Bryobacterales bacterium]